ncbi:DUF1015 family protein [uncultured Jatrophihabitans sp.]|uniref:DUF1015 family protein n=1 Tax=uncultured Jatrophihabitans sp. TaxID=1610747 RepID=UPI0035CC2B52
MSASSHTGLSLAPFRALRPAVDDERLGRLLCPPYDVIDPAMRDRLLAGDPDNAVAVILPEQTDAGYAQAVDQLESWVRDGVYARDDAAAMFVYEMADGAQVTRGLLGAVELRAAEDGVILPHENTMAGPVADRLRVMTETDADLEPIYLVYDGGGAASQVVRGVSNRAPIATARTPDGIVHRLWTLHDRAEVDAIAADLETRRALIADGHHRYATYRERQRIRRESAGAGPWDRGLALLVDSSDYGPQVHPIHRVIAGLSLVDALDRLDGLATVEPTSSNPEQALTQLGDERAAGPFAAVLTDGARTAVIVDKDGALAAKAIRPDDPPELASLDVSVLHRGVVEGAWQLTDDVHTVDYAHDVATAVQRAVQRDGVAVLLRATPVSAVAAVAAVGARMPRKSTLFTPKPASGLVMRRLGDQTD